MGRQLLHILTLILLTVVANVTQGAESVGITSAAMVRGGKAYSILTDQLGTPSEAYDSEGNEVWSRVLDMDGNVIEETGDRGMVPFLFQGQYYDPETGLAYNRFRYYDPKIGAYISQDPIGLDGSYLSLYAYVDNTNFEIDIWGLESVLFQCGTYGSLQPSGPGLQAHEIMRHKYLQEQGLASGNRLADNPSIALDMEHHRRKPSIRSDGSMSKGGAHYHETIIRAKYGLGSNDFHQNHKIELDITQGALRKAGVPASVARKLRKEADKFYKKLKKNSYG